MEENKVEKLTFDEARTMLEREECDGVISCTGALYVAFKPETRLSVKEFFGEWTPYWSKRRVNPKELWLDEYTGFQYFITTEGAVLLETGAHSTQYPTLKVFQTYLTRGFPNFKRLFPPEEGD